jgi:hypothetical protein
MVTDLLAIITSLTHAMSAAALIVLVYALLRLSQNPELRPITFPALAIILLLVMITLALS